MENQTIEIAGPEPQCPESCIPSADEIAGFQLALRTIMGKWKVEIVSHLIDGPMRFGELRRALPGVTQHMLTAQLRELEQSGLLTRTAYAEIPPRVDYELTDAAYGLIPVFRALLDWSRRYGRNLLAERD